MSRDLTLLLEDILQSGSKILEFTRDRSREEVLRDAMRLDAVLRNLQVVGEAVKLLPGEWRATHDEVPWRAIAGLRDVVAHAYFALDFEILWSAIQQDVPDLVEQVRRYLSDRHSAGT